ncbi:MAG: DUF4058 family protein [Planctomycetes bacterium]|nr:DUF4058 family protein [Planctomycetota bacterium]
MTSLFPGMNPYLEDPDIWPDFHGSYLIELRSRLNLVLPRGFVARWDRYVWVDEDHEERLLGKPDGFVSDQGFSSGQNGGAATLAAPTTVLLPTLEAKGKPFIRIIDARGKRVVTVIEMLSPANKSRGVDHEAYLVKRQEYLQTGTNLVEIDLLRGGQRAPVEGAHTVCDYCVLVSRAAEFPHAGFWPLTIRDPLPRIPIPLDPGVADVWISLQECLEPVCVQERYEEDIDYAKAPPPPTLSEADAIWVRETLERAKQGSKAKAE